MRFVAQIKRNIELRRTREIDFVTYTESQRATWAGIRAAGRHVETDVVRALAGPTCVTDLEVLEDALRRTLSLDAAPGPPARSSYVGDVARGTDGSVTLTLRARDQPGEPRQLAAKLYLIAADIELSSLALEAHWSVTCAPENSQLTLHTAGEHEHALAEELLENLATTHQLL